MKDVVCNMDVNPETAKAKAEYRGQTYYFCGPSCLQKFQAEPGKYTADASVTSSVSLTVKQGVTAPAADYTCPMHPEVRQKGPGSCPKCGMALEPVSVAAPKEKIEYVCPMHPQIVRSEPGSCPICGMALEPRSISAAEEKNPELVDMTRRFWADTVLTVPVLAVAMAEYLRPLSALIGWASPKARQWFELAVATPIVLWGGWPFFVRGWRSIVNRSLNMFTLIGLGVGVAYFYSVVATLFPGIFPATFRGATGEVAVYFEAAAVITTLVLLGQVLELRARSET